MSDKKNDEPTPNNLNESNEEEEVITLADLLDEQRKIDEEAAAVLDGSDENFCTHAQGYIKRQALYACLTCVPESKNNAEKRAGVCLACSYKCHDGHDLIELYTKRNFRCDCGTSKILAIRCKLDANKMEDNDKNKYNQNFSGIYCVCHRPYPDDQDDIQDEMIQCVFCEDWFHSRHLNAKVPDSNSFDEMICDSCTMNNTFLNSYSCYAIMSNEENKVTDTSIETVSSVNDIEASVNLDASNDKNESVETEKKSDAIINAEINQCIQDIIEINKNNVQAENVTLKRPNETNTDIPSSKRIKLNDGASSSSNFDKNLCIKPNNLSKKFTGASFWPLEWRSKLCKCINCLSIYKQNGIEYLLDAEDTVHAYLEKGKAKAENRNVTLQDEAMRALYGMDRVTQIEAVLAYNKLKKKLTDFFTSFVSNEQVITAKDVYTFFQAMGNKKKD